jgi:AGZA family xanthine/uracil permease-like MFS transporter
VLLADGTGAIVGSALGSPFPPAVYIGHPGWKAAGGRAGYAMASGVVIALLCFLGLFGLLSALLPTPAIVPILLYIGLLIGAQAFQSVPRLHAAAVVAALIPNIASWGAGQIDNALAAAGTTAAKVGDDALSGAGLVYHGLHILGQGATLAGIVFGAMVTFILERKLYTAAIWAVAGAALCFIGLLHAEEVKWAAAPKVALGYLLLAAVLAGIGLLRRGEPEGAPVPSEDVEGDTDLAIVEEPIPAAANNATEMAPGKILPAT